jgi:hypothetical protein
MVMSVQVKAGACLSVGVPMQMFDPKMNNMHAAQVSGDATGIENINAQLHNDCTLYPNPNTGTFSVHSHHLSNTNDIYV